jgi:hypothetical protein
MANFSIGYNKGYSQFSGLTIQIWNRRFNSNVAVDFFKFGILN